MLWPAHLKLELHGHSSHVVLSVCYSHSKISQHPSSTIQYSDPSLLISFTIPSRCLRFLTSQFQSYCLVLINLFLVPWYPTILSWSLYPSSGFDSTSLLFSIPGALSLFLNSLISSMHHHASHSSHWSSLKTHPVHLCSIRYVATSSCTSQPYLRCFLLISQYSVHVAGLPLDTPEYLNSSFTIHL